MQSSALSADESVLLWFINWITNTVQFSLKTHSAGTQKSPHKTSGEQICVQNVSEVTQGDQNVEMQGGMKRKTCWEEALKVLRPWSNEHGSQLPAAPTEEPLKHCRCFCLGSNLALQTLSFSCWIKIVTIETATLQSSRSKSEYTFSVWLGLLQMAPGQRSPPTQRRLWFAWVVEARVAEAKQITFNNSQQNCSIWDCHTISQVFASESLLCHTHCSRFTSGNTNSSAQNKAISAPSHISK